MGLYAIICTDDPHHGLERRKAARAQHLAWLDGLGDALVMAGPFTDETGTPTGSLIVIAAGSLKDAEAIAAQDPYGHNGVFEKVEVRPWKWLLKRPDDLTE